METLSYKSDSQGRCLNVKDSNVTQDGIMYTHLLFMNYSYKNKLPSAEYKDILNMYCVSHGHIKSLIS